MLVRLVSFLIALYSNIFALLPGDLLIITNLGLKSLEFCKGFVFAVVAVTGKGSFEIS